VSTRVTGTAVLQFPRTAFVTRIVVMEPGSKCGLPESPKQGPPRPVAASFARTENVDRWKRAERLDGDTPSDVETGLAGALLVAAGDNPERLSSEAAFARLCGVAPLPASSGKTNRHRLNRGGDRVADNALWGIVMVRMSADPRTRNYVERRIKEGLSKKEIIRCQTIRGAGGLSPSRGGRRTIGASLQGCRTVRRRVEHMGRS